MSEINNNVLNDDELNEVAGGKKDSKKKAQRVGKCNQCAIEGKMNNSLYKLGDMMFCKAEGHIFKNGEYAYKNKAEIANIKCEG